jgi:lysozyme
MLFQLLSNFFRKMSEVESTPKSSESSELSVSSQAPSQGSLSKPSWIANATKQLRIDEGEVLHAYQDHLGFWTIGVGRLIDKRKGGGISQEESEYLLTNDVNSRVAALQKALPWFNGLDDARKGVLLNMSFQMGVAGLLEFKTTLARVQAGDYMLAADSMLQSKWANQTPQRANRLADQMRYGRWIYG